MRKLERHSWPYDGGGWPVEWLSGFVERHERTNADTHVVVLAMDGMDLGTGPPVSADKAAPLSPHYIIIVGGPKGLHDFEIGEFEIRGSCRSDCGPWSD